MVQNRITYLLQQCLTQKATAAETEEFNALVQNAGNDTVLREALAASWLQFNSNDEMPQQQADDLFNSILTTAEGLHRQPAKVVSMLKWGRMAAAAIIILLLGAGAYFYINDGSAGNSTTAPAIADIKAPSTANAVLTLANGEQVELNKTATGNIAQQNNTIITKLADGQIVYDKTAAGNGPLAYNKLTVPRGSQVVNIVLADGSKVWLNAASYIRYPVAFTGNERTVEMSGEVYFEVAKDAKKRFIVNIPPPPGGAGGGRVEVLGTHFNINAYPDEDAIKTTLLEGSVIVKSHTGNQRPETSVVLKPGEQAAIAAHSQLTTHHSPDTEAVMAWKNGRFEFGGNTIEPVMQQIARWYDVQIEYRGPKPADNFMGGTSRQANVSEILKILEQTQAVRFRVEDKKIIVSKP